MRKIFNFCYRNKTIAVFVPHEDDELNILSGLYDQMVMGQNDVHVVFYTNGDFANTSITPIRQMESIKYLTKCGIPQQYIHFMGYGDALIVQSCHIYNAPDENEVFISSIGESETRPRNNFSYSNSKQMTNRSVKEDILNILHCINPDVVFCCDLDSHPDHRALSLWMDRAMAEFVRNEGEADYYKAFAYTTAFTADDDYYNPDINSTIKGRKYDEEYLPWCGRIRFPLSNGYISIRKYTNPLYREIKVFKSQNIRKRFGKIANNDKVFWRRDYCLEMTNARVVFNNEVVSVLNDGLIRDFDDILDPGLEHQRGYVNPINGTNSIVIIFDRETTIGGFKIYGRNIASITNVELFFNGSRIESSCIATNGILITQNNPASGVKQAKINFDVDNSQEIRIFEIERINPPITDEYCLAIIDLHNDEIVNRTYVKRNQILHYKLYTYPPISDSKLVKVSFSKDFGNKSTIIGDDIEIHVTSNRRNTVTLTLGESEYKLLLLPWYDQTVDNVFRCIDHTIAILEDAVYSLVGKLKRKAREMKKELCGKKDEG